MKSKLVRIILLVVFLTEGIFANIWGKVGREFALNFSTVLKFCEARDRVDNGIKRQEIPVRLNPMPHFKTDNLALPISNPYLFLLGNICRRVVCDILPKEKENFAKEFDSSKTFLPKGNQKEIALLCNLEKYDF